MLQEENNQYQNALEQAENENKNLEDLYSEERDKNEDLIKHLNLSSEVEPAQPVRKQSARPKSASKYGRVN